jgi:transposase InsO family protein
MKAEHPIRLLCQTFEVAPSGYYDWCRRQRQPAPRTRENQRLKAHIAHLHQASRQTYGAPRIQAQLRQDGLKCGRNRIARLMRQQALCGRQKRRYRVVTTDSRHDHPIAPNHLAQTPWPTGPNQTWVADITYLHTAEGWLYLAAVLDLYSRRIVGWALSEQIDTALVLAAWNSAVGRCSPPPGLLFHSDRGVQYASREYRQTLTAAQAVASMSRQGNCYDNAAMESFWSTLKLELVYRTTFATRSQARQAIFNYIESFYNRQRLHSALGYQTPVTFENLHANPLPPSPKSIINKTS